VLQPDVRPTSTTAPPATAVRALSAIADVWPVGAGPSIGGPEPLLQVRIVVPRALPMRGIVPPVFDMGATINVDTSVSPVDAAATPITAAAPVPAGRPPSERVGYLPVGTMTMWTVVPRTAPAVR
jgi:hypothetical protein